MIKEAKKIFVAMVGATTTTYEKANEVINNLVEKGKVTIEEGKELSEELKREVKAKKETVKCKANEKIQEIKPITKEDMCEVIENFNFVIKEQVLDLKNRVIILEEKLKEKEKQ